MTERFAPAANTKKRLPLTIRLISTCLALAGLTLAACQDGGKGGGSVTTTAPRYYAFARVAECPFGRIEDSGSVFYVIVDRDCEVPEGESFPVRVGVFFGASLDTIRSEHIDTTFTDFGTTQTLDIPRLGQREVTLFRKGQWRRIDSANTWLPRDGKIYLLGGWLHGPLTNEVWVSENLRDWQFLGYAPWEARHCAGWIVHRNRLYVVGGELLSDVWSSEDGVTWRQETANAPFGGRYAPSVASLGEKLFLFGGLHWEPTIVPCIETPECGVVANNDVWQSVDGGQTWEQVTAAAPWVGRGLIHGSSVFNDEIYLIGGGIKAFSALQPSAETYAEYSDIWSTRDGVHWERRSEQFSFPPRTHFSVLGTPHGCYVSDGSVERQANVTNDLLFARDCINFTPIPDPPLQPRHASSVEYFNGTVVILGGPPAGNALTDVWQYIPDY
jgi:hypothetical protein